LKTILIYDNILYKDLKRMSYGSSAQPLSGACGNKTFFVNELLQKLECCDQQTSAASSLN